MLANATLRAHSSDQTTLVVPCENPGVHHVVQGAAAHDLQREVLRTRAKAMVRGHRSPQAVHSLLLATIRYYSLQVLATTRNY